LGATLQLNSLVVNKVDTKKQYAWSVFIVCFVSGVCLVLRGYLTTESVAFILLVTLSLIAMFFDILPVLLTAVLSALIWDYFFILPRFNLRVGNSEDKIMLSMYFIVALVSGVLTYKIRQVEKILRQKEGKSQTFKLYNTLLNSLSHELRTPIATIIGATDNLLSNNPELSEDDKQNLLAEISTASLRLNRQVENLLNMSRLESGFIHPKKDWCDIKELIGAVVTSLTEQLEHHHITIEIPGDLPLFKLDYGLMEQVLQNLIQNAAVHTKSGSDIVVKANVVEDNLVITVEDNGAGFPENETAKVFEKFYRLENSAAGGTGLGLSIVKGFTEAHTGTVSLQRSKSGGALFTLKIPAEKWY